MEDVREWISWPSAASCHWPFICAVQLDRLRLSVKWTRTKSCPLEQVPHSLSVPALWIWKSLSGCQRETGLKLPLPAVLQPEGRAELAALEIAESTRTLRPKQLLCPRPSLHTIKQSDLANCLHQLLVSFTRHPAQHVKTHHSHLVFQLAINAEKLGSGGERGNPCLACVGPQEVSPNEIQSSR